MRKEKRNEKGNLAERQAALNAGDIGELLEEHEIVFYEQFRDAGHRFRLIPRDRKTRKSTHDFEWLNELELVELKSFSKPKYDRIADGIKQSVIKARSHGVIKDVFILDLRGRALDSKLAAQLVKYNRRRPDVPIRRMLVWSEPNLLEIELAQ